MDLLDLTLAAVPDEYGLDSYLTEEQATTSGSAGQTPTFTDPLSGVSTAGPTVSGFYKDSLNTSSPTVAPTVNGNQYTNCDPFGCYSSNLYSQGAPQEKQEQVKTEPTNDLKEENNAQVSESTGENCENKDNVLLETKTEISEEKSVTVRAVDPKEEPDLTSLEDEGKMISVGINNVVGSFNTRCHINLKRLALEGLNVIYKRENGVQLHYIIKLIILS